MILLLAACGDSTTSSVLGVTPCPDGRCNDSISIAPTGEVRLSPGDTIRFHVTVWDGLRPDTQRVSFAIANGAVARLEAFTSRSARARALAAGETRITASAGSSSVSATIVVSRAGGS